MTESCWASRLSASAAASCDGRRPRPLANHPETESVRQIRARGPGAPDAVPIAESAGFAPISPYACSKLGVEYMLEDCRTAHGLSYAALRYFNAAGADPEARIGESHSPETHALPLVIDAALGRRAQFSIFGTDYVNDLAAAQSWRWNTSYRRMMRLSSISVPARAVQCVT